MKKPIRIFLRTILPVILLSMILYSEGFSQNPTEIDSLKQLILHAKQDSSHIRLLWNLGSKYRRKMPDTALLYYLQALNISTELTRKEDMATSYQRIGLTLTNKSAYDQAMENYRKSLEIFEEIGEKEGIAKAYNDMGIIYKNQGSYDKAVEYYLKSIRIKEELGDRRAMASTYNNIAVIHATQYSDDKAIEYFLKSLEIKEEFGGKRGMASSYNNIAIIYTRQDAYEKAIEYFLKALAINEETGNKLGASICLANIGNVHTDQGFYDKAIDSYLKALTIKEELEEKNGMAILYRNIADLNIELSDSIASNEKQRLDYLNKAVNYGIKSLELAREINALPLEAAAALALQDAFEMLGKFREAFEYSEVYIMAKDSLFNEEKTKAIQEMATKYETEKKEQQIELQETQLMTKDIKIKQQKTFRNALLGGLGAVIIIIVLVVYAYLQKRKANKKITEQNEQILEANKEFKKLNNEIVTQKNEIESQRDELEQTLENLKRTQDQLIQSEKLAALGSLVAGVAHEINTPVGIGVTAISSLLEDTRHMAELYKKEQLNRRDFKEFLQTTNNSARLVQKNLERTAQLIQSFKQVSADQSTEEQREFLFKGYLEDVIRSLYPKFKNRNIQINIDCDEKLKLNSYPGVFAQILTNLVLNSLTHGFTDEMDGQIDIAVNQKDKNINIEYKDNGKGIPEDILPKIFDPFFTIDQSKGTGLGLHIVYNIVTQKLNGSLKCNSKLNNGVLFRIIFPYTA